MDTWYERLSMLDSLFLDLEERTAHMHVGGVAIFEGPPPPYRDFLNLVEARLEHVPRYRQRVMFVPLKQGRPVWVDETQFDLEYHVRHTALPVPGGEAELKKLAGRLFSQALDRDKPLWEMWLVEGLGEGRFAIISKTHHAMIDGVSGVDLATILMDSEPASSPPPAPSAWAPRKAPPVSQLLVKSVKEQVTHPLRMVREALEPNSEAVKLFGQIFSGLKPLLEVVSMGRAPESPLNVPIGPHRRFEMVELSLAEVKEVRSALGGTVNDVILATVAGGLRTWLTDRGSPPAADLRALVPVSVRTEDQRGTFGNQVSAVFCPLPVTEANPIERLRKVRESMKGLKENGHAIGAHALSRLGDFAPPTLVARAARLQAVTRMFNVVVTNVPGPQFPLFLLGKRMQWCFPLVPLAAQQAIGIALLSYDGRIGVGLIGDADAARDLAAFAGALRGALNELKTSGLRPRAAGSVDAARSP
ncbi:MAG: wax ester/triacylglycerol synthase family O-acyltransferase [Myxococcales bacterium]|nr:wax ester/triacylglycerol synthase family O-acyltransferase [Myxococcales bacterium]